jgi:hypothetical protein
MSVPTLEDAMSHCSLVDGDESVAKQRALTAADGLTTRIDNSYWTGLDDAQRAAVVAHERAHPTIGMEVDCEGCADKVGGYFMRAWGYAPYVVHRSFDTLRVVRDRQHGHIADNARCGAKAAEQALAGRGLLGAPSAKLALSRAQTALTAKDVATTAGKVTSPGASRIATPAPVAQPAARVSTAAAIPLSAASSAKAPAPAQPVKAPSPAATRIATPAQAPSRNASPGQTAIATPAPTPSRNASPGQTAIATPAPTPSRNASPGQTAIAAPAPAPSRNASPGQTAIATPAPPIVGTSAAIAVDPGFGAIEPAADGTQATFVAPSDAAPVEAEVVNLADDAVADDVAAEIVASANEAAESALDQASAVAGDVVAAVLGEDARPHANKVLAGAAVAAIVAIVLVVIVRRRK